LKLFVDTGGWLSVVIEADQHHIEGAKYFETAIRNGGRLITTDYVLDEAITRLAYDHGHRVATQFMTGIHDSVECGHLELKLIDKADWDAAEILFRQYKDVKLSFTDCTSFAAMRNLGLNAVFGFDAHFAMMGFQINPQ
jgi:predicted nucleic acid-binding protein